MTRYQFELAQPSDDDALRRVMSATPMPGSVTLSFGREPNYFDSDCVLGPDRSTIICRDNDNGEIVIVASRSVREMFVGGVKRRVGYLGGLRFVSRVRNRGLLARGFRFLRRLHDSDAHAPEFYLTTIADGNTHAIEMLTSGRAGLPSYHSLSRLHTLIVPVIQRRGENIDQQSRFRIQSADDIPQLIEFLNEHGPRKSFFPAYQASEFGRSDGTFRDLDASSIVVVKKDDQIVGAAGVWDQRSFRQTIVSGYSTAVGLLRPLLNQWNRAVGGVQLPSVGQPLSACFVSFPVVRDNHEPVARLLIQYLAQKASQHTDVMLLGCCDDDPLLPIGKKFSRAEYITNLYAVSWGDLPDSLSTASPCYLELGCL